MPWILHLPYHDLCLDIWIQHGQHSKFCYLWIYWGHVKLWNTLLVISDLQYVRNMYTNRLHQNSLDIWTLVAVTPRTDSWPWPWPHITCTCHLQKPPMCPHPDYLSYSHSSTCCPCVARKFYTWTLGRSIGDVSLAEEDEISVFISEISVGKSVEN